MKIHPMTSQQKANPIGAHILQHYYTHTRSTTTDDFKINIPVFSLNSAKEIPLIMHLCKLEGITDYGMVVVSGGRHRTPVLVTGDEAYMFESLGTDRSRVGVNSAAQVAMAIQKTPNANYKIRTFKKNRQVDAVSCGSESFMALKQAARIAKKLDDYTQHEHVTKKTFQNSDIIDAEEKSDPFFSMPVEVEQIEELPPEVGKYAQAQSAFTNYPYKTAKVPYRYGEGDDKDETVNDYLMRHKTTKSIPIANSETEHTITSSSDSESSLSSSDEDKESDLESGDEKAYSPKSEKKVYVQSVMLKNRKLTATNTAVDLRREKHARIVTAYAQDLKDEQIKEIVKESSGINLMLRHLQEIPDELFKKYGLNDADIAETPKADMEKLIDDYVVDEAEKKRDEKTGIAPKGIMSLTELAMHLKNSQSAKVVRRIE